MEMWFTEKHTADVKFSIRVDRQIYTGQSDFQRIDVFESKEFGRFLTLDGYMMLTERDEFIYHEMMGCKSNRECRRRRRLHILFLPPNPSPNRWP